MQHIDVFFERHIIPDRDDSDVAFSIADTTKRYLLSDLLPYDPQSKTGNRLASGLKEYELLLVVAEQAMESLAQGKFSCFDPLVGENACQIRAVKNCLIFAQYPVDFNGLLKVIRATKEKIAFVAAQSPGDNDKEVSLGKLLKNEGGELILTYSEMYLIKAFLLTIVKTGKAPKEEFPFVKNEYTDIKKLKAIVSIGTMFAENLVKKVRESLSLFSVAFVRELVLNNPASDGTIINSDKFLVRHNRLHCLPCYRMTKVLMLQALHSRIPLVIIARQMAKDKNYEILKEVLLCFKSTSYGYEPRPLSSFSPHEPALVLLANACRNSHEFPELEYWKKELAEYNPVDLVLAYAAAHRQYPDVNFDYLVKQERDEEYNFYKSKAVEWGCTIENPSLFFLSHAFCEKIEYVPKHFSLTFSD